MKMEGLNLSTLETGNEKVGIIQPSYIEQIENVPEFLTCHSILKPASAAVN